VDESAKAIAQLTTLCAGAIVASALASGRLPDLIGNPVEIWDCPAAVIENDRRFHALVLWGLGSNGQ
jgi:hypothetical protein